MKYKQDVKVQRDQLRGQQANVVVIFEIECDQKECKGEEGDMAYNCQLQGVEGASGTFTCVQCD